MTDQVPAETWANFLYQKIMFEQQVANFDRTTLRLKQLQTALEMTPETSPLRDRILAEVEMLLFPEFLPQPAEATGTKTS